MASTSNVSPCVLQKVTSAIIQSTSADSTLFRTSRSTVQRKIRQTNEDMAIISKAYLKEKILVSSFKSTLHFDGKTLKEMVKGKCMKNDRLAVLVVCEEESYLFGVPALESSSGANKYNAMMTLLEEFELSDYLIGIVFIQQARTQV